MVRRLPRATRARILHLLCEGSSMRSVTRVLGVSLRTVARLLVDAGEACQVYHDEAVQGLTPRRVQCDELWSYTHAQRHRVPSALAAPQDAGDCWTWTALDPETKLMIAWYSGSREVDAAMTFLVDLRRRLAPGHRIQLTADGHQAYVNSVPAVFGSDVDFARLLKVYQNLPHERGGTRPVVLANQKVPVLGNPDLAAVSTSHVERQNLNIRMGIKRFTRKTNAFSKKVERHCHALTLFFTYLNFCRVHLTLQTTPAVASGLAAEPYPVDWLVQLVEDYFPATGRQRRQPPF